MEPQLELRRTHSPVVCGLVVAVVFLLTVPAFADISGHWEGAFNRQGAVQAVSMDFHRTETGWSGTYDIPDMILYREPIRDLAVAGDTVLFRVFWGGFTCILHDDIGEATGENPKWGPPVSLHLKRSFAAPRFRVEPMRVASGPVQLEGELLIPSGNPPFPAVVVIEGSSTEGRSFWTYRSIGDLFARNGFAAFIYDKRGAGASEMEPDQATFDDLSDDVVTIVHALSQREDIDASSIGLFGISQGGWIAPKVAVQSPSVAFVVLLGGPAVSIWDQELQRVEYSMKAGILGENDPDEFASAQIDSALEHTRLGFAVAQDPERWDEWVASVGQARRSPWANYIGLDSTLAELQEWMHFRYDPTETLRHLQTPTLALFGENDVLVPPAENAGRMQTLLNEAGNDHAQIVVFPGVGHDFFTGASLVGNAWEWPAGFWRWNRRAVGLADTIITWTARQLGK